jgi:glutaminyl-peptide cyclotransferase
LAIGLASRSRKLERALLALLGLGSSLAGCGPHVPRFDGDRAYDLIERQTALGPRNPGSRGHEEAREMLVEELRGLADIVQEQTFLYEDTDAKTEFELTNIIASFSPENRHRIMLGAHWDTRPRADCDPDTLVREEPILGANDGGSGVAVLLEVARLLHERPPAVGVDIILFDGEDYGREGDIERYLLGSTHFAATMGAYRPLFGVIVDMVGDRDLDIYVERYSATVAGSIVDLVWDTAERLGLGAFHREIGYAVWDDHVPLLKAGVPCIVLIDFDYEFWHTLEDTPDKCSHESLAAVGQLLLELVYRQGT